MVFKNEKLIAVLPANINNAVLYSHQGLTYGGLVFSDKLKFKEVMLVFKSVLKFLSEAGIKQIELKIIPSIYSNTPNDELLYLCFLLDAKLSRSDALTVIANNFRN